MKNFLSALLFIGLFLMLSLPGLMSYKKPVAVEVTLQEPEVQRGLASLEVPDQSSCKTSQKWRWVCTREGSKKPVCHKDRLETYKDCSGPK